MNHTTVPGRVVALLGVATVATLMAPAAAHAAPASKPGTGTAVVRTAHFSPDTPGVDVYLTSYSGMSNRLWQSDVGYGDVTAYRSIKPGLYIVVMRPHGAAPSSPAGLKWTLNARAGRAYTVAAAGANKNLTGVVLRDSLAAPRSGHGLVRVIQASSRAPRTELVAAPDTVLASDAKFPTSTGYRNVKAGTWTVRASALAGSTGSNLSTSQRVTVKPGSVSSIVVLDAKNRGIQLRAVTDASGAAVAPQGSIDAGGGGTAGGSGPGDTRIASESTMVAGLLALLLLGAVTTFRRRSVRG